MLCFAKELRKCSIRAIDDSLGTVDDFLFDDRTWLVAYLVVDTRAWLPGRRVVLPRAVLGVPDWQSSELAVEMTREAIESGPGVESTPPHAIDAKMEFYDNYSWLAYPWGGFVGAAGAPPVAHATSRRAQFNHLRSMREITGYRIEAEDGRIGHVEDFLLAAGSWDVEAMVVDTRNWLPGRKVAVRPEDVSRIDWRERLAHVDLPKEAIEQAPPLEIAEYGEKYPGPRLLRRS